VELFTFNPQNHPASSSQIPLNEIPFKKLGYLTLDSNERSSFQARELKSVHIDSNTALLKLIFNKNHLNSYNNFNQIGLVALNCIGPSGIPTPPSLAPTPQNIRSNTAVNFHQPQQNRTSSQFPTNYPPQASET
jgi:hypothetical protein